VKYANQDLIAPGRRIIATIVRMEKFQSYKEQWNAIYVPEAISVVSWGLPYVLNAEHCNIHLMIEEAAWIVLTERFQITKDRTALYVPQVRSVLQVNPRVLTVAKGNIQLMTEQHVRIAALGNIQMSQD